MNGIKHRIGPASLILMLIVGFIACSDKPTSSHQHSSYGTETLGLMTQSDNDSNTASVQVGEGVYKQVRLLVGSCGSHVYIGPEGSMDTVIFNFGYAPQLSKISHIYWLHNVCDDSLVITQISPG